MAEPLLPRPSVAQLVVALHRPSPSALSGAAGGGSNGGGRGGNNGGSYAPVSDARVGAESRGGLSPGRARRGLRARFTRKLNFLYFMYWKQRSETEALLWTPRKSTAQIDTPCRSVLPHATTSQWQCTAARRPFFYHVGASCSPHPLPPFHLPFLLFLLISPYPSWHLRAA